MSGFEKSERGVMRVTLFDGSQVELSQAMAQALSTTVTATGDRAWSCLGSDVARETAQALERRGLVNLSPEGVWLVTERGLQALDDLDDQGHLAALLSPKQAPEPSAGKGNPRPGMPPKRVTVHPEVPVNQVKRLQWAIKKGKQQHLTPTRVPPEYLGGSKMQLAVFITMALIILGCLALNFWFGVIVGAICWFARGRPYLQYRRERDLATRQLTNNPFHIIEEHKGLYATGEMLDEQARGMLGRAQAAVDTVLESSLHREGLLLDEIRNRVVLADVEWWLARDLYEQARTRHRIDSNPAVGERSRQAAERAHAALAADVERVESRIRTLESYADRVRAAELEVRDRELAAELDAIADQAEQVGAVRPQNDESLSALIQAQELALEIAAFSDDRDPEGTVR